jgi:HEAT repeat protein
VERPAYPSVVDRTRFLLDLPAGARRDLLRVLTSPSHVRADVVRQFRERGDEAMVEVLFDLEADELIRLRAIQALHRSLEEV